MRSWIVIALAVALFVGCSVLFSLFSTGDANCQGAFNRYSFGLHAIFFFAATIDGSRKKYQHKLSKFIKAKSISNSSNLSLFKGREAKLNRVILVVLFQSGPMVVYDVTKELKKRRGFKSIRYSNVNRRVRALESLGYLEMVGSRETRSGSMGSLYQPTIRAKVAFYLNVVNVDAFVRTADDEALTTELAALALYLDKDRSE